MDPAVDLLQWALPRLGYRYEGFRRIRRRVVRRLERRARELALPDLAAYGRHLEGAPGEWVHLDALLNITISKFYRDRALFDHLREGMLADIARRGGRCWSLGCASGEEPYTVAILAPGLAILATDRDPHLLERAGAGLYRASSLRDLPAGDRALAFEPSDGLFRLRDEFRANVEFRLGDLRREMPEGPFDLVFCRYVAFTYFDDALQRAALEGIAARLAPTGLLAIGRHERLPKGPPFFRVAAGLNLFRPAP
jgi:chemotaxis protein methyltransferase CheR